MRPKTGKGNADGAAGWARFWELFFPPRCPSCGKPSPKDDFCPACKAELIYLEKGRCLLCGGESGRCACAGRVLCGAVAPFSYHAPQAAAAMRRLKFAGQTASARPLARYMADWVAAAWPDVAFSLVVPVPMTRAAVRRRGYNQAALLGRELARRLGMPCQGRALQKLRENQPQHNLPRQARQKNVRGVYSVVDERKIRGKIVLLVDDILTTGATMRACARALRRAGASAVYGVAASAVPLRLAGEIWARPQGEAPGCERSISTTNGPDAGGRPAEKQSPENGRKIDAQCRYRN